MKRETLHIHIVIKEWRLSKVQLNRIAIAVSKSFQLLLIRTNPFFDYISQGFKEIFETDVTKEKKSSNCLMNCGRPKATILFPCIHQSTCNACFVLWKLHLIQKKEYQKKNISITEDWFIGYMLYKCIWNVKCDIDIPGNDFF